MGFAERLRQLGGHRRERDEFAKIREPDILFEGRTVHPDNVEVIPTPGHTPGSTCFFVNAAPGRRYLFTGDTLYLANGSWRAGYIKGVSNRGELVKSLELLRELQPSLVISSAFAGPAGYQSLQPQEWAGQVDRALENLLRADA